MGCELLADVTETAAAGDSQPLHDRRAMDGGVSGIGIHADLGAGGLLWMAKRNRKQQQELAAKLDAAEVELAAMAPGVACLEDVLPRASATLDYIATHAGHALRRWSDQLGPGTMTWESMEKDDQQRFLGFTEVAGAQVAIVTLNLQGLLTTRGRYQDDLIQLADQMLTKAQESVEALA